MGLQFGTILWGVALGAGGFLTVLLTDWMHTHLERKRLATVLYAEVAALWDRYSETLGTPLAHWNEGQPLPMRIQLPQRHNFFAVYDRNTDKLGLLKPREAMTLVSAYALAKGHLESISLAAEMTKRDDSQPLVDELGRGLRREAMQMRQVAEEASRILARYVGRPWKAEGRVDARMAMGRLPETPAVPQLSRPGSTSSI
jgi:hypothetical protein